MECHDEHHFFVPLENVRPEAHSNADNFKSNHTLPYEIIKDWLTNLNLRRHLNNQVAEVMRLFLEIRDKQYDAKKQFEAWKSGIREFCPICGKKVKNIGGDGYSDGYQCENGHCFGVRANLTFPKEPLLPDGSYLQLHLDFWDPLFFAKSYVTEPEWQKAIAPQLRNVLNECISDIAKRL